MRRVAWTIGLICLAILSSPPTPARGQGDRAPRRPRQLWGIVVGVGSPLDPTTRAQSSGAEVQQALKVFRWLSGTAGWDRSHLLLLTDLGGSDDPGSVQSPAPNITPTRKNLDWAFQNWLDAKARPGDVVVFYYAGQSWAVESADRRLSREFYLLPSDVLVSSLAVRGWPLDRALDRAARQGKYQVVCLLGTTMQPDPAADRGKPRAADVPRLSREWLKHLARWPGVTAWLAADRRPAVAAADPAIGFTDALLKSLGDGEHKQNLAGCLRLMHREAKLKSGGFQAIGGVPPDLTLWADQLGRSTDPGPPEMVLQVGHADRALDIVSTPDSRTLITASQDSTIRVWSPGQKALLRILTGHSVGVTSLGLSGDGRWLISGGGYGEVLVHDLARDYARRTVPRQPHEPGARVHGVSVLPDGRHFVTTDSQGQAFLWDLGKPTLMPQRWVEGAACRLVACGGGGKDGAAAALCGDGSIRLFGPSGAAAGAAPISGGRPSAIAISPDGALLGVGFEDGRVVVRHLKSGRQFERKPLGKPIDRLAFSSRHVLAIGHESGAGLLEIKDGPEPGSECELLKGRGAEQLAFSPDGSLVAACARDTGELKVWAVRDDLTLESHIQEPGAGVLTLAFSADGLSLITGTKLGTVRSWPLGGQPEGRGWTIPANRGKVQHVSAAPSRNLLLSINELQQAQVWDLPQRTCRRLGGTWLAGEFLGDDALILSGRTRPDEPARLVRIDRGRTTPAGSSFASSSGGFAIPKEVSFEVMALSPDGARVAAAAGGSQEPLVCVWETATGRLTHWIADPALTHPAFSIDFSSDGRLLATAGDSTEAELWDLGGAQGPLKAPAVVFQDANSRDIRCIRIRPGRHRQLVSGHTDGKLLLWTWDEGQGRQQRPTQILAERYFAGAVHAMRFSPDGHYLTAAGQGTMIWLGEMGPERARQIRDLGTPPHHFEQINALAVWPDWAGPVRLALGGLLARGVPILSPPPRPPLLVSGSDDTTIRFWDLQKRSLLGTFCTAGAAGEGNDPIRPEGLRELEWVLFTPDGHFDSSEDGRRLVRFRRGEAGRDLEQFDDTALYSLELTDSLRSGRSLEPVPLQEPPPVAIDPPTRDDPTLAETRLRISLSAGDLRDVRIYHNGVPIPSGLEPAGPPLPDRHEVPVRLVPGANRFYAMAGREGAYDSRSEEVEVVFEGTTDPGRLHVIALGVGDYDREKLTFAKRDAERLSQVLHNRGLNAGQQRGKRHLLTDRQVNPGTVTRAFADIAREVKGHPQDTVVLFLAGHTGVFDRERFCLLLPSYPFPPESPLMVAARGANPPVAPGATVRPQDLLPVSSLVVNLMRLEALNRLVIVDACQAGAILSDPQVDAIRKWMEIGSRKARTAYLMATRRGEPALEVEPLRHGLFTYALLRGMREIPAREERPEVNKLKLRADADYSADGTITTAELDAYVQEVLPPLARLFPDLVVRRSAEPAAPVEPREPLDQSLRLKATRTSFPLLRLGAAAPPGGS
ncbi:MAG: WD40 repeat domain-containing protein [Isosphaeraceae bacterium]